MWHSTYVNGLCRKFIVTHQIPQQDTLTGRRAVRIMICDSGDRDTIFQPCVVRFAWWWSFHCLQVCSQQSHTTTPVAKPQRSNNLTPTQKKRAENEPQMCGKEAASLPRLLLFSQLVAQRCVCGWVGALQDLGHGEASALVALRERILLRKFCMWLGIGAPTRPDCPDLGPGSSFLPR